MLKIHKSNIGQTFYDIIIKNLLSNLFTLFICKLVLHMKKLFYLITICILVDVVMSKVPFYEQTILMEPINNSNEIIDKMKF